MAETDAVQHGFGDVFGAVADCGGGGLVDQVGEAADSACGALVEVGREVGECAGVVVTWIECGFHGGDQFSEWLVLAEACGEGPALDQGGPSGELCAAHSGEECGVGDVDARVHERCGDAFGEVFEEGGGLGAGGGAGG
ncbi:hypothetical protein ACIQ9Q_38690 [Streptomyces sp. NPDC094438]|uniref:hypothetical protein n=1 Tax=Streptomyces sp. NPDC094438 TaxID=3366061 RepID=UPI003803E58E